MSSLCSLKRVALPLCKQILYYCITPNLKHVEILPDTEVSSLLVDDESSEYFICVLLMVHAVTDVYVSIICVIKCLS